MLFKSKVEKSTKTDSEKKMQGVQPRIYGYSRDYLKSPVKPIHVILLLIFIILASFVVIKYMSPGYLPVQKGANV